jgi:hypothetical protein
MKESPKVLGIFILTLITCFSTNAFSKTLACNSENIDKFLSAEKISYIDVSIPKSKKWVKNYIKALQDKTNRDILDKYKKKFSANIQIEFQNDLKCLFPSEVRISGDHKDHLSGTSTISSLDVKLIDGNINSVIKFKLFIPKTKRGVNEVFSTALLRELGFLAPLTYIVPASFNGQETTFLFQEKITKEFIESNNLREAPILEGDERFLFANDLSATGDKFGLARIKNNAWTEKGSTSLKISKVALSELNRGYLEYLFRKYIYQNRNDRFFGKIPSYDEISVDKYSAFHTILVAIGASHALRPHNRTFYYDPMYKAFKPIYYDGNSFITRMTRPNMRFMYYGDKVNKEEVMGSSFAFDAISKLNQNDFHSKLIKLGLNYSLEEVNLILETVSANIRTMIDPRNINLQHKNNYVAYFSTDMDLKQQADNKKLVFSTHNNSFIEVCDLLLSSCVINKISIIEYASLLEGRYIDESQNSYVFIGNKQEYISGMRDFKPKNIQEVELENGSHLIVYGSSDVIVNKTEKTIQLTQKHLDDRILIKNGVLNDWSIVFNGMIGGNLSKQRFDQNLITGCLTFIDMKINNVNIEINNAYCEDGVNLVRVNGNVNSINVNNAKSDAIDIDFSKLLLNKITVKNAGNDCVDFSFGDYQINSSFLENCKEKAISVGEKSKLIINSVSIKNSITGIASKDSSEVFISDVNIEDTLICFTAYNKKQEFWGGKLTVKDHNCQSNQIVQEIGSLVEFI